MKVHLRFDSTNDAHTRITIFVSGKNCGELAMSPAEAIWFHHILAKGCSALSPPGLKRIEFISSGQPPNPSDEQMKVR